MILCLCFQVGINLALGECPAGQDGASHSAKRSAKSNKEAGVPITPTYPGVYVQELPSGVHTIAGVSTSVALFLGRAAQGPIGSPQLILNPSDFERTFTSTYAGSDLARQVRMFFQNGGTQAWVVRLAKNATQSTVTLQTESGTDSLVLAAVDAGVVGETIRAAVTYSGVQPESTFNVELFRWGLDSGGRPVKQNQEIWTALSMDPSSARYAPLYLTQNSKLVNVSAGSGATASATGFSQGGRPIAYATGDMTALRTALVALFPANRQFRISVDGAPLVSVDLGAADLTSLDTSSFGNLSNALDALLHPIVNGFLQAPSQVSVTLVAGPSTTTQDSAWLRISSSNGDVWIVPGTDPTKDLAVPLMLGTAQGGLEVSRYAAARPAPTGLTYSPTTNLATFGALVQNAINAITVGSTTIPLGTVLQTTGATDPFYKDSYSTSFNGNSDGVREKLGLVQKAVNDYAAANPSFRYQAAVWGLRFALVPVAGPDNLLETVSTAPTDIGTGFLRNVRYLSLGAGGIAGFQTPAGAPASDGTAPDLSSYTDAFAVVDQQVDLFNLLILPADKDHTPAVRDSLWGPASTWCESRTAFLLVDAPAEWTDVQTATNPSTGVNKLRTGVVNDHAAVFFPRITIAENGLSVNIGASGSIAGVMARIDGTRGVWKAPAGLEAALQGLTGLEYRFSDAENGVLNPVAINTLRVFPSGIVNWGARTLDGDDGFGSDWKYIPVRRTALFLEASLYRGTQWVVFEPNDEPLWAQIRLNVGAFMNTLFRQGAFQGQTPKQAYLVKCDSETTTQDDIDSGVVNILVGFAPLKPAEFVIIQIQQLAGNLS